MPYKNKEDKIKNQKEYRKTEKGKIAHNKANERYYKKNLKRIKEYHNQYREENREKIRESGKQYRETEKGKENARKASIKYSYGLFYEDWLKIWEEQDGKCAICEIVFSTPSHACVDHNHKTNKVRGLLCRKCNAAIGYLNDDPEILIKATEYLLKI